MSERTEIVKKALEAAHHMRVDESLSYMTPDATYRFASFPAVTGIDNIRKNLYDTHVDVMKSMEMDVVEIFEVGDTVIFEMVVRIRRIDDRVVELPCVDVIRLTPDNKIRDGRVYMDPAPLIAGLELPNAPPRG
jgi:limonene-1,2-epoxide hydrolase